MIKKRINFQLNAFQLTIGQVAESHLAGSVNIFLTINIT
jgi:hypothetical protein